MQQTPWLVTRSRDSALLLVQEGAQSLKLSDEVIVFWGQLFNIGRNRSAVPRTAFMATNMGRARIALCVISEGFLPTSSVAAGSRCSKTTFDKMH